MPLAFVCLRKGIRSRWPPNRVIVYIRGINNIAIRTVIPHPNPDGMLLSGVTSGSGRQQLSCRAVIPGRGAVYLDVSNTQEVLSRYDTLLLDCDGVLWNMDHFTKMTGIAESITKLRSLNKRLCFVTNNSLHAREDYLQKFKDFAGFEAEKDDVFSVAYAAALYLRDVAKIKGTCYMIGNEGMARELREAGLACIGAGPDLDMASLHPDDLMAIQLDPSVDAVLVGFDHHFNYNKLYKAASYLSDSRCHYVATNDVERGLQLSPRHRQPLTGALVRAVSAAVSREPLLIGKPHAHVLDVIKAGLPSLDLSRTLMVGDSVRTDIGFASTVGLDSLLVMTGATSLQHLRKCEELHENVPTYYTDSFGNFEKYL